MIEDVVRQIKTLLQNNIPGKLDTIEAEKGDGVVLDDIQVFFVERGHKDAGRKYPNITVSGLETSASNILSSRRELRHKVSVEVADRAVSVDTDLLQTRLWRYVEAVERVLGADTTLSGKVIDSAIVDHKYPEPFAHGDTFVKTARLTLTALERPSVGGY
ncbi:MAG: hypothetical protein ACE5IC_08545 [Candidatus Brocadiales bacterium]